MNKSYLIVTLLLSFSFLTYSQTMSNDSTRTNPFNNTDDEPDYSVGVKAGWQYGNMYRSGNTIGNDLNTFYVGFFSEAVVSENMKAGSGLEYFQNGFDSEVDSLKFKMHTLSLPFYWKYYLGPVYGMAGGAFNFKLGDNREDFPGGMQTNDKISKTNFFDLPLSLGLGVEIGRLRVEAKYNWGIIHAAYINGIGYKNHYLQAGMALML